MTLSRLKCLLSICFLLTIVRSPTQVPRLAAQTKDNSTARELEIAARFAPILYQALGENPRSDYITNFDFDNDWRGDNNWNNAEKRELALNAYVYYAVAETTTHFFIHYAAFHPRDYKGGERRGALLSEIIREGIKRGAKYDPTGLADEAALAHENDLEGALVVVKKHDGDMAEAQVAFVETLHHNNFARYIVEDAVGGLPSIKLDGQRPLLYIEPKGHGIEAYIGDQRQAAKKDFLRYAYSGRAEDPSATNSVCRDLDTTPCLKSVGYQLAPISMTLWAKAKADTNATYGTVCDYKKITLSTILSGNRSTQKQIKIGKVGCAFLGNVGGQNMARPPWAWFDKNDRNQPLGEWFFDPASTIKRDFQLDGSFSISYVRLPFWATNR
jgi:hypothetical protein